MIDRKRLKNFGEKMNLFRNNKVINWHEHVCFQPGTKELNEKGCDKLIETASQICMDFLVCSLYN